MVTVAGDLASCQKSASVLPPVLELIGPQLHLQRTAKRGLYRHLIEVTRKSFSSASKWGLVLIAIIAVCFIRIPHWMSCELEVKPVDRRFVAAPFDSVLAENKVDTGVEVSKGTVLARLDEDELLMQISSVKAKQEKVRKTKDSALANGETLEAQQARLEFKRLEYERNLLENRREHLEITSPIDGVCTAERDRRLRWNSTFAGKSSL